MGRKKKKKKKDVYHIAVVIYILEILPGLLHCTEMVTDALAVCPAVKPDTAHSKRGPTAASSTCRHHTYVPARHGIYIYSPKGAAGQGMQQHTGPPPAKSQPQGRAQRWGTQKVPLDEGKERCCWACVPDLRFPWE